jgi:hypothetical protein
MSSIEQNQNEVIATFNAGIRICGGCGTPLQKVSGCQWIACPRCGRGQCALCGKVMAHSTEGVNSHGCDPNALLATNIQKVVNQIPRNESSRQQLCVTIHNGEVVKVEWSPQMTVLQLKQAIQTKTGLTAAQIGSLVFAGKTLDDRTCLSQYQIRNNSSLSIAVPVKGG